MQHLLTSYLMFLHFKALDLIHCMWFKKKLVVANKKWKNSHIFVSVKNPIMCKQVRISWCHYRVNSSLLTTETFHLSFAMQNHIRRKFYKSMVQRDPPEPCPALRLSLKNFTARYLKPTLRANSIRIVHPNSTSIRSTLVRKRLYVSSSINARAGVYIVPCGECNKCYVGQSGKKILIG